MKRKGFTLIELLAVIVVLAIIALIATPTILGVIDKAKKGTLKNSAYGLIESANLYYAQYGVIGTERFELDEENKLSYKGKVEDGTILINNKGKIMICVNDGENAAYKNYSDTNVIVVSGKTCNVNKSETQILLDGENTIDELTNQELTILVDTLQNKIDDLELLVQSQNEKVTELYGQLDEKTNNDIETINSKMLSIDNIYPIGSIYISASNTNPANFIGGEWESFATGRTLIGTTTNSEVTGGSNTVTLTLANLPSHTHSIPSLNGTALSAGAHSHGLGTPQNGTGTWSGWTFDSLAVNASNTNMLATTTCDAHTHTVTTTASTTGATGSGTSFNVQNPYITVYMWKRIK